MPPIGTWEPDANYRDDCFSSFHREMLTLDPLDMGVAIKVENMEDDGACWIRLRLTLQLSGERVQLRIGQTRLPDIPREYDGRDLDDVADANVDFSVRIVSDETDHTARGYYDTKSPIGFLWTGIQKTEQ